MAVGVIYEGDFVRDPMDGTIRQIGTIIEDTCYMVDGGVMGLDEIEEVILESEMYG
jgi:hypothetical protein